MVDIKRRNFITLLGGAAVAWPLVARAPPTSDAFEERYVLPLLERTQHNVSKAARLAGTDRNYLYRMMKKHGIARKE